MFVPPAMLILGVTLQNRFYTGTSKKSGQDAEKGNSHDAGPFSAWFATDGRGTNLRKRGEKVLSDAEVKDSITTLFWKGKRVSKSIYFNRKVVFLTRKYDN